MRCIDPNGPDELGTKQVEIESCKVGEVAYEVTPFSLTTLAIESKHAMYMLYDTSISKLSL